MMETGRVGFLNIAFDVIYSLLLFVVTTIYTSLEYICLDYFFYIKKYKKKISSFFSYQHGKKEKLNDFEIDYHVK